MKKVLTWVHITPLMVKSEFINQRKKRNLQMFLLTLFLFPSIKVNNVPQLFQEYIYYVYVHTVILNCIHKKQ